MSSVSCVVDVCCACWSCLVFLAEELWIAMILEDSGRGNVDGNDFGGASATTYIYMYIYIYICILESFWKRMAMILEVQECDCLFFHVFGPCHLSVQLLRSLLTSQNGAPHHPVPLH